MVTWHGQRNPSWATVSTNCKNFWSLSSVYMILISQKNIDRKFISCIPFMQPKDASKEKHKQGCSSASRTPFSPLMSVTKLPLRFWAYLDLAASSVSAQGGTSSWETQKAFGDFINFTYNKSNASWLCILQRLHGTLILEVVVVRVI